MKFINDSIPIIPSLDWDLDFIHYSHDESLHLDQTQLCGNFLKAASVTAVWTSKIESTWKFQKGGKHNGTPNYFISIGVVKHELIGYGD